MSRDESGWCKGRLVAAGGAMVNLLRRFEDVQDNLPVPLSAVLDPACFFKC